MSANFFSRRRCAFTIEVRLHWWGRVHGVKSHNKPKPTGKLI